MVRSSPALEPGQAQATQPLQLRQTLGYFAAFVSLGLAAASMGPTLSHGVVLREA